MSVVNFTKEEYISYREHVAFFKHSCQTEIAKFHIVIGVEENIARLEVAMQNTSCI
jgi:hypothetical protein